MRNYNNKDEFMAHVFNDTIDYIFDTFIFEKMKSEEDLVSLLGGPVNKDLDNALYLGYMACKKNIKTYEKIDKSGSVIEVPRFQAPDFSNKMFDRQVVFDTLLYKFKDYKLDIMKENISLISKNYKPNTTKWLKACKKLFFSIKPSKNSIYFLQSWTLSIKKQLLNLNDDQNHIALILISQSLSGDAKGGCGKTFLMEEMKKFITQNIGSDAVFETTSLPGRFTTPVDYAKKPFAFISDPENHLDKAWSQNSFNNIVDKVSFDTDMKYDKPENFKSISNLIISTNHHYKKNNTRRWGEIWFHPIQVKLILESDDENLKKYILDKEEYSKVLYDFFFCVPDTLLYRFNSEERSESNLEDKRLLTMFNLLFDQEEINSIADDKAFAALKNESVVTPSKVSKLLTILNDGYRVDARRVYDKIFCKDDGTKRWDTDSRSSDVIYMKYKVSPIPVSLIEIVDKDCSYLEKTAKWWDEIIITTDSVEGNSNLGFKLEKPDLVSLRIPSFSDMYTKTPSFDTKDKEFICVTPYKKSVIEEAVTSGKMDISRGCQVMEPIGFVFESDKLSKEEQLNQIKNVYESHSEEVLGIVDSGNKSIHLTTILNIEDFNENELNTMSKHFKEIWSKVGEYLGFNVSTLDVACANIGRLTRCPDGKRQDGKSQPCLHWNNKARLKSDFIKKLVSQFQFKDAFDMEKPNQVFVKLDTSEEDDLEKLNRIKNGSKELNTLKNAVDGILPSGENYYGALCAGYGIGLSKKFLIEVAEKIAQAHPSNIRNGQKCVENIFSRLSKN